MLLAELRWDGFLTPSGHCRFLYWNRFSAWITKSAQEPILAIPQNSPCTVPPAGAWRPRRRMP